MDFLSNVHTRENYIFTVILSLILFVSYWSYQLGLSERLVLVLPQVHSIIQIFTSSIILIVILPILNTITYYLTVTFFTKLDYKTEKSKIFVQLTRGAVILFYLSSYLMLPANPYLLILIIFSSGFIIEKLFHVQITHDLVRTNGQINIANIVVTATVAYQLGHAYAKYTHDNYSVSLISTPNASLEYLGNISGQYVIKQGSRIIFANDVILEKIKKAH